MEAMGISQPGLFSKACYFEGYTPKPPVHFEMFRVKARPKLKPKGRVLLSIDWFVQTYHKDSPHYPLIVNNAG